MAAKNASLGPADTESGRGLVKSAERTARIMETLAESADGLSLSGLQERTGYPRSSLYALLRTLTTLKWIETSDGEQTYGIGPRALLAGTAYLDRDPALPFAVQQLESLRAETGYTVHYARLDAPNVIYLASREVTEPKRLVSRVGRQLPAHATSLGKALLAERTSTEVDAILPEDGLRQLTEHTVATRAALHDELEAGRTRGWSIEREQNTAGLCCVAACVGYRIPATDAISCSMPLSRTSDRELARVTEALRRHADELAGTLRRKGIR
ncbi:IclR family transcriptional regulator [Streptomyces sp. NPDC102340]|uniref:IclR family transcriptional regulator n=1 Tax=unclassified Streptomyces TaxID=2593676 RepID=UPI0037F2DFA2